MNQLCLALADTESHRTSASQRDLILGVLARHPNQWVSALDFKRGRYGFHVDAVSQRIGDLKRRGYAIESTGRGGVASYRLVVGE
jgi:hypothetical protein